MKKSEAKAMVLENIRDGLVARLGAIKSSAEVVALGLTDILPATFAAAAKDALEKMLSKVKKQKPGKPPRPATPVREDGEDTGKAGDSAG